MAQEIGEYRGPGSLTARVGGGRHPADAPGSRLAFGADKPDGDELVPVEGADRECGHRLMGRELVEALVRSQHRLAQGASLLSRYWPYEKLWHRMDARRGAAAVAAYWKISVVQSPPGR